MKFAVQQTRGMSRHSSFSAFACQRNQEGKCTLGTGALLLKLSEAVGVKEGNCFLFLNASTFSNESLELTH